MIIIVVLLKRQTLKHKWLSKSLQKGNKSCQSKSFTQRILYSVQNK